LITEPWDDQEPQPDDAERSETSSLLLSWLLIVSMALIVIVGLLLLAMRSAG
jgi:hypothetical protein